MAYGGKRPIQWPFTKSGFDAGKLKDSSTAQRVGIAVAIIVGLGLLGVGGYYLWQWFQHRRATATITTPTSTTTATADIFGPTQIYTTSVVEHDQPHQSTNPVPPGNYPISACVPDDFHDHVTKQYDIYKQEKPHKAFIINNACSQSYYTHSQPDSHKAVEMSFAACQKREPGRCGVVSADDDVFSHK